MKKLHVRIITIATMAAILLTTSVMAIGTDIFTPGPECKAVATEEIRHDTGFYDEAISDYLQSMDAIYVSQANQATAYSNTNDILTPEELDRQAHISAWAEDLQLTIIRQESTYSVTSVLSSNDSETKVLVYIWTNLEYINDGEPENTYLMGFGIDHILTVQQGTNGELTVIGDSFVDNIFHYSAGEPEDIALLQSSHEEDICKELDALYTVEGTNIVPYAAYNASAAIAYSDKWIRHVPGGDSISMSPKNYNPEYYYYDRGDCTNFASQCLFEGGMSQDATWWTIKNTGSTTPVTGSGKSSSAWIGAGYFVRYWKSKGYNAEVRLTSSSQAVPGNLIYYTSWDGSNTWYEHVMLIVGVDSTGNILYNAHSDDANHMPLSETTLLNTSKYTYYTIELQHNYSYTCTDTTHTKVCSVCGEQDGPTAHTWRQTLTHYICTVCGHKVTQIPDISR